jgi:hypothetical protein
MHTKNIKKGKENCNRFLQGQDNRSSLEVIKIYHTEFTKRSVHFEKMKFYGDSSRNRTSNNKCLVIDDYLTTMPISQFAMKTVRI